MLIHIAVKCGRGCHKFDLWRYDRFLAHRCHTRMVGVLPSARFRVFCLLAEAHGFGIVQRKFTTVVPKRYASPLLKERWAGADLLARRGLFRESAIPSGLQPWQFYLGVTALLASNFGVVVFLAAEKLFPGSMPPINAFTVIANAAMEAKVDSGELQPAMATFWAQGLWVDLLSQYFQSGERPEVFVADWCSAEQSRTEWCLTAKDELLRLRGGAAAMQPAAHAPRALLSRSLPPAMLFGGERRIGFAAVDERRVVDLIQSLSAKMQRWRMEEWRVLGVPSAAQFSSSNTADGCKWVFYKRVGAGGGMREDGLLEVALGCGGGLPGVERAVITLGGGTRVGQQQRQVDIFYRLLLHECRAGAAGADCKLIPWIHPPTDGIARLVAKIDAACLYDKRGQYSRF